ncbi:MAG TPA: response regulator, partial [Polyangiales bacterium]
LCEQHAYDAIVFDPVQPTALAEVPLMEIRSTMLNPGVPAFALPACEHMEHATAVRVEAVISKHAGDNALALAVQQALTFGPATILAIDDTPSALRVAEATLRRLGHRVLLAASARTALELIANSPPDLVVLDLIMEGMDGFEFIAHAQQLAHARSIPVVIWTAKELSQEDRGRLTRSAETSLGASPATLVDQIRAALAQQLQATKEYHA